MFGWLADYSFPFGQALELLFACFKGTISSHINTLQQQLQRVELVSQPDNKQQIQKLNNLESQSWLYQGILERLGEDPAANHGKIARTIEALEFKRNEILQELEPRRPQNYRTFANIQTHARSLLASQAERDYERLDRIVTNVVFFTRSKKPSRNIFSEVISKIAIEITQNANHISPYRLRLAYKINDLIKLLSDKFILEFNNPPTAGNYQEHVDELQSQIALLSHQFNSLLQTRQGNIDSLNKRIQEISNLTRTISDLQREMSGRDADINALRKNVQSLTDTTQGKQSQIDALQSSISNFQRDIQNADDRNQNQQNQIDNLQNQLFQLDRQNSDLQKQIENKTKNSREQESEIGALQNEKNQLNAQKLDLERRYRVLLQKYQQQQNEIVDLTSRVENLSQQAARRIETRGRISVEDYKEISNQSDYVFVDAYARKDGTPVRAHYRRRPSR